MKNALYSVATLTFLFASVKLFAADAELNSENDLSRSQIYQLNQPKTKKVKKSDKAVPATEDLSRSQIYQATQGEVICWNGKKVAEVTDCPANLNPQNSILCKIVPKYSGEDSATRKNPIFKAPFQFDCENKEKTWSRGFSAPNDIEVSVHYSYKSKSGGLIKDASTNMNIDELANGFEATKTYKELIASGNTDIKQTYLLIDKKQKMTTYRPDGAYMSCSYETCSEMDAQYPPRDISSKNKGPKSKPAGTAN